MSGIATSVLDANSSGSSTSCHKRVYQGVTDTEMGKFLFFGVMAFVLFSFALAHFPCQRKTWLDYMSNHIIRSSDPPVKQADFAWGRFWGTLSLCCLRGGFVFCLLVVFFLIWILFLYLPEWKEKPAVLV